VKNDKVKYYLRSLVVEGSAVFPVSMLYRECAIPASQEDAETIERAVRRGDSDTKRTRTVKLTCFREDPKGRASAGWANFGWKVAYDEARDQ